jgi:hydrogenase maturation protease
LRAYKNPLVVGIGNSLRADDALGSKISETIKTQISLKVISAEPSLENYTSSIKKADSDFILFIDAAEIPPDKQFAYFFAQDLANISLHLTHDTSLKTTLEYLQKEKPSDILILGIKGYNYDLGGQMSEPAQRTEKIIENFFIKNFPAHK